MSLRYFINSVRKRIFIFFAIPLLTVGIAYYFGVYSERPQFEANITLYVNNRISDSPNTIAYNDVLVNQQLVKDYSELIKSRTVLEETLKKLGLTDITPDELADKINVSRKNEAQLIEVKVANENPDKARLLAEGIGATFLEKVPELLKVNNISIVDHARQPVQSNSTNPLLVVILALFTGLPAGAGAAFLLEYSDNKIKVPADITEDPGLPVLGAVPLLKRTEAWGSLREEIVKGYYTCRENGSDTSAEDAYARLMVNLTFTEAFHSPKTISITSCNQEEGKTTTAINLADTMARNGMKVLLVDADFRKAACVTPVRGKRDKGLFEYLSGMISFHDVILDLEIPGLFLLPRGNLPKNPIRLLSHPKFSDFLQSAQNFFDLVIIDTPALRTAVDASIIAAQTEGTVLVISSGTLESEEVKQTKEELEKVSANVLGMVLTRIRKLDYSYYCRYCRGYRRNSFSLRRWLKNIRPIHRM